MDLKLVKVKPMKTKEILAKATPALEAAIKAILAHEKEGTPIPKDALRVGGLAAVVVNQASDILDNPEKFDKAGAVRADSIHAMATVKDIRAKAEAVSMFKSAERRLSKVHKVEAVYQAMTSAPKPRGRKAKSLGAPVI